MGVEVSILIVSFNTGKLTVECLRSVPDGCRGITTEVVVVDNNSTDGSPDLIERGHSDVRLFRQQTNLGFGRAVNVAAAQARGEYLLLLNPDTVVLPDAITNLVEFARKYPDHGVYGGRTLRADHTLEPSSCWGAPSVRSHVCFGLGLSTLFRGSPAFDPESMGRWNRDSVRSVGVVTGCLMLLPRTVFDQLGGFDPRYFMYGEDVDLCVRARQLGWDPAITPTAEVVHHVGASSSRWADKHVMVLRGKVTLAKSHWRGWRRVVCLTMLGLGVAVRAALGRMQQALGRPSRRSDWPALLRRRAEWSGGYSVAVPVAAVTDPNLDTERSPDRKTNR